MKKYLLNIPAVASGVCLYGSCRSKMLAFVILSITNNIAVVTTSNVMVMGIADSDCRSHCVLVRAQLHSNETNRKTLRIVDGRMVL